MATETIYLETKHLLYGEHVSVYSRVRNVARWDSRLMISLEEGISLETAIPG